MPELYIGNMSKQIQQFCYRIKERQGVIVQPIPIGGQIRVSPNGRDIDLSSDMIDHILGQHIPYGIVPIDNVENARPFDGVCYSIGKPITGEMLHHAMLQKEQAISEFGRQLRQEAAVAVNTQIEENVGGPIRGLEMSFIEEEPKGGYADGLEHVAEGVRVARGDNVQPMRGGRR